MNTKLVLMSLLLIIATAFGCKKDSESKADDLSSGAVGNYLGTWVVQGIGQVSGTCEVVKVSSTKVKLILTAGGQSVPTVPNVSLSDEGGGKMRLTYSDSSGTLNGTIEGNAITLQLDSGGTSMTFSGVKQ